MKTVVITGANRGIGLALCKEYLAQGWQVFAVCRVASPELQATSATVLEGVDVTDVTAVKKLPVLLAGYSIDVLISNAGVFKQDRLGTLNFDDITQQFMVNALAPIRICEVLLDHLSANAKIAFITSRMGSMADNTSGGYFGYRMSKAALNAAAVSLSHDIKPRGVAVAILHPGFVQTAMVNFAGDVSAQESAHNLVQRIEELTLATSGRFLHAKGEQLPW